MLNRCPFQVAGRFRKGDQVWPPAQHSDEGNPPTDNSGSKLRTLQLTQSIACTLGVLQRFCL